MNNNIANIKTLNLNQQKAVFDWRTYWYMAKRRKWLLIFPTILFGLSAYYYSFSVVPVYQSSTIILISGGKLLTRAVRSVVPGVTTNEDITTVKNYILSPQCIAELINTLQLRKTPALKAQALSLSAQLPDMSVEEIENDLLIKQTRENIKVVTQGRDIIEISSEQMDPHIAYLMTKTLAAVFFDEFRKRQLSGVRGIREFSEEQLEIFREKLRDSEEKLTQFKQGVLRAQVMSDTSATQETLRRLRADVVSLELAIRDKQKRLDFLGSELSSRSIAASQFQNAEITLNKRNLMSKVDDLVKVLSNFDWKSPQIISLNDEINQFRDIIRHTFENIANSTYSGYDDATRVLLVERNMTYLDYDILNYEKDALKKLIANIEVSLTQGPTYEMKLANLQRVVDQNRRLYISFFQQSQGTQIEEQIQRKDAKFRLQIIKAARKPLQPMNTGTKLTLLLVCLPLLGLALGGGIVYGLDSINQSIKDVHEFEREFQLRVWGVVPEIQNVKTGLWQIIGWLILVGFITAAAAFIIYVIKTGGLPLLLR
ncbi:hypothetical protein IIA28_16960 [candidate division KSB1 bacterium]|nr:hypothetical protein [candidate division KSB1 bacterium]